MKMFIVLFSVLLLACGPADKQESPFADTVLPVAHIPHQYATDSLLQLHTISDSSNSYSLLLPQQYDTLKKWPVILFLDPHASGSYPIQLYRKLASAYGIIMAGSNRSKNGMAASESTAFVNGLLDDLGKRFSLDNRQLILCGFSGGARVAGYTALQRSDISAVISCSAGIAAETAPRFICISTAGTRDMNYNEVESQYKKLEQQKARCYFFPSGKKHEWAPYTVMSSSLACITLEAMGAGILKTDTVKTKMLIAEICDNGIFEGGTDHLIAAPHLLAARNVSRAVKDTILAAGLYNSMTGKDSYAKLLKNENELLRKEQSLQQFYAAAITNEPLVWWPQNLKGLDTIATSFSPGTRRETDMHFRVWGYLSLMSYSYAGQALRQNNFPAADHFISIYKIVDPRNCEWAVLRATLEMKQQQPENALLSLKTAVKLGFKDKMRIMKDPAFQSIRSDKRLPDLFAQ